MRTASHILLDSGPSIRQLDTRSGFLTIMMKSLNPLDHEDALHSEPTPPRQRTFHRVLHCSHRCWRSRSGQSPTAFSPVCACVKKAIQNASASGHRGPSPRVQLCGGFSIQRGPNTRRPRWFYTCASAANLRTRPITMGGFMDCSRIPQTIYSHHFRISRSKRGRTS